MCCRHGIASETACPKIRIQPICTWAFWWWTTKKLFRDRLCRALRERGWETYQTGNGHETLEIVSKVSPDLVLLDLKMPEIGGLDLIEGIKRLDSTITIVILTGYGSIATAMQGFRLGADHYLGKPVDADQILAAYQEVQIGLPGKTLPATTVPTLARVEWEHIQRVLRPIMP